MSNTTSEFTSKRGGTVNLTESQRHQLLASDRRRLAIEILTERIAPVDLDALAAAISAREERDEAVDRVAISLHHAHLPKMDDAGVLDYNAESHRIERIW
ncbi:DUF7344 domain-containing protein [Halobellus sp. GM3]|uniref:DUF7344 domain-containing protein n=1 Tax=Halobellus sp. GM3 TaxID=3458410 RepID=UPI00403DD767